MFQDVSILDGKTSFDVKCKGVAWDSHWMPWDRHGPPIRFVIFPGTHGQKRRCKNWRLS